MDQNIVAALVEQILGDTSPEAHASAFKGIDLDEFENEARASAEAIIKTPGASAEALATAQMLTEAVEYARAERTRRAEAANADAATRDEMLARLQGEAAATAAADTTTAAAAGPEDDESGDGESDGAGEGAEVTAAAETATAAAEIVEAAAPARRPSLAAIAAARAADPVVQADEAAQAATLTLARVTAASDVPGKPAGSTLPDMEALAQAMISRMSNLGRSQGVELETVPVATFSYADDLQWLGTDAFTNGQILRAAAEPMALTASGGFCAPREVLYGFFGPINTPDGLAQDYLPTVGSQRGGMQYPVSPDIRDAFTANPSRTFTAANDTAGASKAVTSFSCASTQTCDVEAQYVILKFGNFAARAYPEWVQHWIRLSMDVHAHKVSAKLIAAMVSGSRAVVPVGPNAGATSTIFGSLDLAAADYRCDLKMRRDAPLEVWLPNWINDLIRSDLAHARKGGLETLNVTDAQIASWFAVRNLIVRTVADWQNISGTNTTGASTWPAGLNFMVFSPGTWVKLDMGTLDLGVVRDSVLNQTNDWTMFVETFEQVCKVGTESRVYSASICATGAFSEDQNLGCSAVDIPSS